MSTQRNNQAANDDSHGTTEYDLPHIHTSGSETSILPSKPLTIVHISDLHLTPEDLGVRSGWRTFFNSLYNRLVSGKRDWKKLRESSRIKQAQEDGGLCIISGDLCQRSPDAGLYEILQKELDGWFPCPDGGRRWIAVPGNHDRRRLGNFLLDHTNKFEQGLGLGKGWKRAWWNPDHPCIVVPLDSNPRKTAPFRAGPPLARGVLGDECHRISGEFQRVKESVAAHFGDLLSKKAPKEVASYAMNLCAAFEADEIKGLRAAAYPKMDGSSCEKVPGDLIGRTADVLSCLYMARVVRCVVFHHHPVGVRSRETGVIQDSDAYLLLTDAGAFLHSARENRISLVLHGHRHVSHQIAVHLPDQDVEEVGIVGAGSSTQRSGYGSVPVNLITINEAGEVEVEFHDPWAHDPSRSSPPVHLRKWSQVRKHLSLEADKCARISSEDTHVDVSILPYGDAIMTVRMHGLKVPQDAGQRPRDTLYVPISYTCPTQIGPVQVACQIEKQNHQTQEVSFRTHQEPGYGPGEWHGSVEIGPTAPERGESLSLTTRFMAFTTFAMNPWQASFMYPSGEVPYKEFWRWRCRIPARKQLFVALETTGDRASAATFEKWQRMYGRIDGCVDEKERDEIVVDRATSGQRLAFTVPTPVWGSVYGLDWEWAYPSPPADYLNAPVFTGLRAQLEDEARGVRSSTTSTLRSRLYSLLRPEPPQEETAELEVTLYVLTRPTDGHPGKLIQIAWNQAVERSGGQEFVLNFGAGVAGRAASLQRPIAWASCDLDRPDTLADFYLPTARDLAHTGIVAIPIPDGQPYAVLSVASKRDDLFSNGIRESLGSDHPKGTPASDKFSGTLARIYDLAKHIARELNHVESALAGGEQATAKEKQTALRPPSPTGGQEEIVVAGAIPPEIRGRDDAICLVNPDDIQRRLQQFEIGPRRR